MANGSLVYQIEDKNHGHEDTVTLDRPEKILTFGEEATKGISQFADEILSKLNLTHADESSRLLTILNNLMSRFDKGDFDGSADKKGILSSLISKIKKRPVDLPEKYTVFSKEIDQIFSDIKRYELEINHNNDMLDRMYEQNMKFYEELGRCIKIAASYLHEKINQAIRSLEAETQDASDGMPQIQLGRYQEIRDILEQRINDLELAKAVSLQIAPQIKLIQRGNYNLIRKINSAFVITMPLFKQNIIQAITLSRQKLYVDSMKALDDSTNRLLLQNARNVVLNTKATVEINQSSAVRVETIEESYNTIINGIKDIEQLQEENRRQREDSLKKLDTLRNALMLKRPVN